MAVALAMLVAGACRASLAPPVVTVNLDAPPEKRWAGAVGAVLAAHPWQHSFGPAFAGHNATMFHKLNAGHWQSLGAAVRKNFPQMAGELEGISSQFVRAPVPPHPLPTRPP